VHYGDAVPAIAAGFSNSFVNGQTSAVLTTQPTCTTAYTTTSNADTSPSTSCSGAVATNYAFSYVSGAVTIQQANLTIGVTAASVSYPGSPYAGATTCKATGVNGEYPAAALSFQDGSHNALPGAPTNAGNYYALCSAGGTGTNYVANSNTAAFTISRVTPAFNNLVTSPIITFGTTSATLSGYIKYTYNTLTLYPSGSVLITLNGVTQSAPINTTNDSFSASFNTSALTVTAPGPNYGITYHYGGDTNFNAASPDGSGTLTVNPAPTSLVTMSSTVQYSDLATLTATVSPVALNGQIVSGMVTFVINGISYGPASVNTSGVAKLV